MDVCYVIDYVYSCGVVYWDLKFSNIMFGCFGEMLVVDWGLVKLVGIKDVSELSKDWMFCLKIGGSLNFMEIGLVIGIFVYMSFE